MHRFAQRSFRAIQNRCHARRISVRKLRTHDNTQNSKYTPTVHAHLYRLSTLNQQPSRPLTSPYRHGALLCVHQVEPAPPRLSWIPEAPRPGVRSSGPPSRVRLRQPARSYQAAFVICRRRLPSLHRQISFAEIRRESRKVSRFRFHLLPGTVKAFHFLLLRRGSAILRLAVRLVRVKAVGLVASRRLEREKGSRQVVVAGFFAAGSLPATGCSFPVGPSGSQTSLVIADLSIAADFSAAAAVVVDSAAAAFSCEQAQRALEALGH